MKISVKTTTPAEAATILLDKLGPSEAMRRAKERTERASKFDTMSFYEEVQKELRTRAGASEAIL